MKLKIMTYNIQHGFDFVKKDRIDLAQIADIVRAEDPDAIVFNEVRGDGIAADYTDQTGELMRLLGWNGYFGKALDVPGGGPYGNAVLSKHPFAAAVTAIPTPPLEPGKFIEPRCIIRAEFDFDGTKFALYGSHFGLTEKEQENAVETLGGLLDKETLPCCFMGDLNMEPQDGKLDPVRARLKDSADVFEYPMLSFPSDKPEIKIDYIFVSRDVKVLKAEILPIVASDHRPYTAEIEF